MKRSREIIKQREDSAVVVRRFFEIIHDLIRMKKLRGKKTFTEKYGINRPNFNTIEKDPARYKFHPAWLSYLVTDFDVSADWLLTGKGQKFRTKALNDLYEKTKDVEVPDRSRGEDLPEASNNPFGWRNKRLVFA